MFALNRSDERRYRAIGEGSFARVIFLTRGSQPSMNSRAAHITSLAQREEH